ncbi:MAG: hypothetical protein JXB32_03340 [Deltaproteobacteria bacterium]|nr:hypothetical protein [Deltaproteobacteria bacterium]
MDGPASLFSDAQRLPDGPAFVTEAGGAADVALWRTDDLGRRFVPVLHRRGLADPVRLYGLWFLDPRCGFVCGETGDGDGVLLGTQDGGLSWEAVADLGDQAWDVPLTQVVFADDRHGFAVGAGEAFWRTVDGGRRWRRVSVEGLSAHGVFLLDGTGRGWALSQQLGDDYRILGTQHFLTLDAGATFEPVGDRLDGEPLRVDVSACAFWDEQVGVLCGPDGLLLRTTDGARRWERRESGVGAGADLNFLVPLPDGRAWALGMQGTLLRTADTGRTWQRVECGATAELNAAAFADPNHGFVVGEGGLALWTADGGRTFERSVFG